MRAYRTQAFAVFYAGTDGCEVRAALLTAGPEACRVGKVT